jgi:AcrR family transcriptional regulator
MAVTARDKRSAETRRAILDAARERLLADGYASLSTRKVAVSAGVPLSQLHYHFGSKQQLILSLLEEENRRRLERQTRMYAQDAPLWQRYEQACDFLEDDLDSGYVRLLQEMIAAGWSNPAVGGAVRDMLLGWLQLLTDVAREAETRYGPLSPFTSEEIAGLIGQAFMGGEAMLLLGFDRQQWPIRSGLRRISFVIRQWEQEGEAGVGR